MDRVLANHMLNAFVYLHDMKQRVPAIFRNKYIIASLGFAVWVMFINDIDVFYVMQSRSELNEMKGEVARLNAETARAAEALRDLDNPANLEKFARETYFLQRPGEDIYIIKDAQ